MRWRLLALTVLVGLGCPRARAPAPEPLAEVLAEADEAWEARGELGFDPARHRLEAAHRRAPTDPEVLWRLVRLHVGMGLAEPDRRARINAFASARSIGVSCLSPVRVPPDAEAWERLLAAVGADEEPCVLWTAWAWVRWLEAMGGNAAALDLPIIDALMQTAQVREIGPAHVRSWAEGVLQAARPEVAGRDLEAARNALEATIAHRPEALAPRVDLVVLVAAPKGMQTLEARHLEALDVMEPTTPEDQGAWQRLQQRRH